jgi:hypothetical protein
MVLYLIFSLGNDLSKYNLVMNFQSLGTWFLKGHTNKEYKYVMISIFFIVMKTSSHILWHAINKHEDFFFNYENI